MRSSSALSTGTGFWLAVVVGFAAHGQPPQRPEPTRTPQPIPVLEPNAVPDDARLGELKTLNDHFPFVVPDTAGAWHTRSEALKRRVLVATGLWPMPEKTPLNAVIFGKTIRDGFTVEKVYFESLPGHYVSGLLFRPQQASDAPLPGVLSPHGHGGRMQRYSDDELTGQIAQGGEHFERSGRMPKLARCAQLARMGCVAFIFDMIGYADSQQISREVAHRHANVRPEERSGTAEDWVFFSPQADSRLQSIMGLQTWNGIRALDFLASLPDVDPQRLAVTGGSGGGTQSILLGAIDDRVQASFPNGMVSTSMQGGCYCENCNLLRVGTGNVELAALFAPKPQAMTAADDWTRDMMSDGYPELKWLYAMIGDEQDVYCRPMLHFKHNYNYVTRATMYQWMNRHLNLGLGDPVVERDFEPLTEDETTIWDQQHPRPAEAGIPHERAVCRWFDQQASEKLDALTPKDADSLDAFRNVFAGAWRVIFDQPLPAVVEYRPAGEIRKDGLLVSKGLLIDPAAQLPLLTVKLESSDSDVVVIWSTVSGKSGAFDDQGLPVQQLDELLRGGATVMLPDLLQQGELKKDGNDPTKQRVVDDKRAYSAFTFAYNPVLVADRSADLLSVVAHAKAGGANDVRLLGTDGAAPWVAAAAALSGQAVDRVVIDTDGFRFADVADYQDANFVPGAVKYGDLPVLLSLRSPYPLTILDEPELPAMVAQVYHAAGADEALTVKSEAMLDQATVAWLVGQGSTP